MTTTDPGRWRKSSFSGTNGDCVEVAEMGEHVAIRNSNQPDRATLALAPAALAVFVADCKSGQLDHLA